MWINSDSVAFRPHVKCTRTPSNANGADYKQRKSPRRDRKLGLHGVDRTKNSSNWRTFTQEPRPCYEVTKNNAIVDTICILIKLVLFIFIGALVPIVILLIPILMYTFLFRSLLGFNSGLSIFLVSIIMIIIIVIAIFCFLGFICKGHEDKEYDDDYHNCSCPDTTCVGSCHPKWPAKW